MAMDESRISSDISERPKETLQSTSVPSEKIVQPGVASSENDYTTFTNPQKRLLTLLVGLGAITSPLTATIYLPLLPLLRQHFHTSAQAINLTLSIYVIFQAISPVIFGPYSDAFGRRPIFLITLFIYCIGNLGLAINQSSFAALLTLRALQSLGASAASPISYGIVADVCVPRERGSMLGPVSMALNIGTCVGPIVGGLVAYKSHGFQWVFWALVILGFVLFIGTALFLPETARSLVGNGSVRDQHIKYQSLWSMMQRSLRKRYHDPPNETNPNVERLGPSHSRLSRVVEVLRKNNPLTCLRILFYRDAFLVLFVHGSFYVVDYSLNATAPDIYSDIYHLNELQIGLTYLPRGFGIITGSYFNGWLMDHNYKYVADQIGQVSTTLCNDDWRTFPFERARTRGSPWLLCMSTAGLIAYGWVVWKHAYIAIPLILQYILGFAQTCFYTLYSTLLVDAFPERPSTAAAAASVVRCAMAATALAILQPLLDAAGRGWYFTALGIWSGSFCSLAIWLIRRNGMKWRQGRSVTSHPCP